MNKVTNLSRATVFSSVALALLLVLGVLLINLRADDEEPAEANAAASPAASTETAAKTDPAVTPAAAEAPDRFEVPTGDVAEQLAFIEGIISPTEQFASMDQAKKYWNQAAPAMEASADRILAAKTTDEQAAQAVEFKAEALRLQAMLGDKEADKQRDEFLDTVLKDPRFGVKSMVGPIRLIPKFRRWGQMSPADREQAMNRFVADIQAAGPTAGQAQILMNLADQLGDTPDRPLAVRALQELLPALRESQDPTIQELVSVMEGLERRLNLPGNKLELAGTLMDGQPFDWEAYRGKVVLVDYWASWCPQCLAEVPNILQAYHDYHDKGFEIVGVCLDKDKAAAAQAIRQTGMVWPQLFETENLTSGWTHTMAEKYSIMAIPRVILVNQEGDVVNMMAVGPMLRADLEQLLGPPGPSNDAAGAKETRASQSSSPITR